uniref:NADH-ubiquinone oxidoreductase chain 4 n=1 Tax=Vagitanus terminalis TaxID=2170276 RepID=A0A344AM16_9HEMI|nr:NADH dehydrogenase subunit 4 [Vagitanus terminalis]
MLKFVFMMFFMIPLSHNMLIMMMMMIILMLMYMLLISKDLFMMSYELIIDSTSHSLIILTIWISILMIMSSLDFKYKEKKMFTMLILSLMILLILSFMSLNIMMFYIFFESSLIPIIIIIMGWGYQPERMNASYYLMFYTLFASLPLLLSILYLYSETMSMIMFLMNISGNFMLYLGMIMAFLVKIPMFMFHFWLPKAHVEAPVSGSMILAGILLKLGAYGLIRVLKIIPLQYMYLSFILISISLVGSILVSLNCMVQVDIKSMIAYSSVAHMGLVVGGIMTMNQWGMVGSYYMIIGHGLCSSGLFCLINILYKRTKSRSMFMNKGMLAFMPSMSLLWFLMCSSNMSCPPTINLAGEILIINSLISWNPICMFLLSASSFLSACYCLYLFSYTQHGMNFSGGYCYDSGKIQEYLLIMMHWVPLNLIILKLNILM